MSDNIFQQRFKDKVVLVTGGGAGIGMAIGKRFVQEGAKVWLADINEEGAKAAAVDLTNQGPGIATAIIVDISNETEVSNMIDTIVQIDGSLDILVNNAARFILKSCEDATSEDWDAILGANIKGYAYTTKYALQVMKAKGDGNHIKNSDCAIVNLGSISSFIGQARFATYSATKAAVLALTRCTAIDCGKHGIRVNAVCPGPILTDATKRHAASLGITFDEMVAELTGALIQHRLGVPEEVAAAVSFLASKEASFITGTTLMVDGGYTAI